MPKPVYKRCCSFIQYALGHYQECQLSSVRFSQFTTESNLIKEYKITSLAHHTHTHTHTAAFFSFSCMLVVSFTAVIDCLLFIYYLDVLLLYLAIQLPDCKYVILKLS